MITGVNLFIDLNAMVEIKLDLESITIDFKETFDDKALKTLCAFANTDGGTVLIGISDDKTIKGIKYKNKDIETITNQIIDSLNIHPDVKLEELLGKNILKIEVQKSNTPKSFRGKYYKRVGNTTREMLGEELKDFFLKDTNWDSLTGDYTPDEIDQNTVKMFLSMAKKANRITAFNDDDDILNILERLKLINNGKLTNAAIMLFGKDPQKYFITALVRVGRFKGDTIIISDKVIDGNLFNQAINAEAAIQSLINVRYEITGKLQRDEIWDYPLDAIREMLLNAIIHRDYFKYNFQTQIKIYDDYLWCSNAGSLPVGLTLDLLKTAHRSIARNPLIMDIFYRSGLVEEYGSGTQRIIQLFKEAST